MMGIIGGINRIKRYNDHQKEVSKMARYGVNYHQVAAVLDELREYNHKHLFSRMPDRVDYVIWKYYHPGKTILNTPIEEIFQWIKEANIK